MFIYTCNIYAICMCVYTFLFEFSKRYFSSLHFWFFALKSQVGHTQLHLYIQLDFFSTSFILFVFTYFVGECLNISIKPKQQGKKPLSNRIVCMHCV